MKDDNDNVNQLPPSFALMLGKCKKDHKKVLKSVRYILPNLEMKQIVLDFEAAVWHAVHEVLPRVTVFGCAFHWSQAVWQKVQKLGHNT